ncbi:MAG: bifunctional glycosyltransferase family 2/GtrA family protein [Lachnospiraceae bacterium]|nr:bifunctional glycosyltransferase family 2/GtrA family protein [Lachnospiraceae bacterium]
MKVTAVLPSLNPDEKLAGVVDGLLEAGFENIVLVNDGSAPEYQHLFDEAASREGVILLTHEVNKGKGRAMKTAFDWIQKNLPDSLGIITVDGDGQHLSKDVKAVSEAMLKEPDKLWLGVRDFSLPQVPERSRKGNLTTRTILRLTCGVNVTDTQTGLRAVSTKLLPFMLEVGGERYEYETQMLLDAKRNHIPFGEVVIDTVYIEENQTSHYRPFRDSMRIFNIIFKYLASSIVATLADWTIFTLLNVLLSSVLGDSVRILLSTYCARAFSAVINFICNRKFVFKDKAPVGSSALKYFLLAVCQAAVSYGLVLGIKTIFSANLAMQTVIKVLVDMFLAIASYQIQLRWVFNGKTGS